MRVGGMLAEILDPTSYTLSLYAIPTFVTAAAALLLGITVLLRERGTRESRAFFWVTLTLSVWLFAFSWMYCATSDPIALWWAKVAYLGVPYIPAAIYQFTVILLRIEERYKTLASLSWLLSTGFAASVLLTDSFLPGLYHYWWGPYPRYGWLSVPYLMYFFGLMVISLRHFWVEYHKATPGTIRWRRLQTLVGAFGIVYLGSLDFLAKYGIPLYPFGYLPILVFVGLAARVIWRYRLIDITPAFAAEQILATMTNALVVLDQEGVVRVANQAASLLFGRSESELVGERLTAISADFLPEAQRQQLLQTGRIEGHELSYTTTQGTSLVLEISASALQDQRGRAVGFVCIGHDITQRKRSAEALWKSLDEIRDLYNNAPCGYHSLDPDGTFLRINDTELRWLGYTREEVIGKMKWSDLLTAEGLTVFRESFPRLKERGWVRDLEFQLIRKDGTTMPVLLSATAIKDVSGNYVMSRSTLFDITERKQAEVERYQLASIVESSDDAIIGETLERMITSWNRGAERVFGYTAAEAIGRSTTLLIPPDRPEEIPQILERIKRGELVERLETVRIRNDGAPIDVALTISPIRDAGGRLTGASTIAHDITERKRAEEARRKAEAKYRRIFENAVEGIFQTTIAGRIVTANPSLARLLGYASPEELVAEVPRVQRLYVEPGRRERLIRRLEAHGSVTGFEIELRRKDGTPIWVSASIRAIRELNGKLAGLEGMLVDITERKRLEQEILEAGEREQQRIAQDLHDGLCQQLTGIGFMSKALEQKLTAQSSLDEAVEAAQIANLINEAVAQTRELARGLVPAELEVGGLISALRALASRVEHLSGVRCTFTGELPLDDEDQTVATHLYRMAQEAIQNAIKHGQAQHVVIGLTAVNDTVTLTVQDDGVGFPDDVGETGMGLRSMHHRADVIGASLDIHRNPGGGTIVVCSLQRRAPVLQPHEVTTL